MLARWSEKNGEQNRKDYEKRENNRNKNVHNKEQKRWEIRIRKIE